MNTILLTPKELSEYLHISESQARKLLKENHGFTMRIGYRVYAHKPKLDKWLDKQTS